MQYPPTQKGFFDDVMDGAQGVLTAAGFVPGLGAVPDLVNAGISGMRGRWDDAVMSGISAIPGIGDAAQGANLLRKAKGIGRIVGMG